MRLINKGKIIPIKRNSLILYCDYDLLFYGEVFNSGKLSEGGKMKILQTCLSYSWGGMEMYTLQTSILLRNSGHQVELLCADNSRLKSEAEKEGFKVYSIPIKYLLIKSISKLKRIFAEKNFDVIHAEASKDLRFIVPALIAAHKKTPLLLTKHVGSKVVKKDILHKILYKRVDLALAISGVIKNNLLDTTPLDNEKVALLHDAIDAEKFNPQKTDRSKVREEFNISEMEIVIGMTGRFSPGKGHEEFLAAAKQLLTRHKNLRFMIVGEASRGEDEYAESIKALAYNYGIGDKVIFTGYRSDIPDILAAFDIYLFPSHAEAFGLALVEAMSMGLPTVCSNSDGVLDIAVDGVTSFLFAAGNRKELSRKVENLITDPVKRNKLGKEARKRVLDNFDTAQFTRKLVNIYKSQVEHNSEDRGKAA